MRVLFLGLLLFAFSAQGNLPKPANYNSLRDKVYRTLYSEGFNAEYQIGEEWGKKAVTKDSIKSENEVFKKAALRTARFRRATAFYLGQFDGRHIMATNYHVLSSQMDCTGRQATFSLLGGTATCIDFLGAWTEVDFALFEVQISNKELESALLNVGQNMAFKKEIFKGQELLTIGHGVANNPMMELMANKDSDCKVFSKSDDLRFMWDPDEKNPGDYQVWSFSNGCDVSHGDSGSAMIDRNTGDIVGIIWTGRIPKNAKVQSKSYLEDIFDNNSNDIWTELSYAAPATKIYDVLKKHIEKDPTSSDSQAIESVLNN